MIDGFVCNMRGEPKDNYFYCYMTGIYDNVLPSVGDYYPVSRKQTKDELYYSDARKKNVLLGFHIDNSTFDEHGNCSKISFSFCFSNKLSVSATRQIAKLLFSTISSSLSLSLSLIIPF